MRLEKEKVRSDKYYRIGYLPVKDKYVMATVVTWYDRFYTISEEEYNLYKNDIDKLDKLADQIYRTDKNTKRFLFSEKREENNEQQKKALEKCMEASNKSKEEYHFDRI